MEIKIICGCGTKYKFDAEPVNGRLAVPVSCPSCGTSGIMEANQQIAQKLGAQPQTYLPPTPVAPPASGSGLRINRPAASAEPAVAEAAYENGGGGLLDRKIFLVKERVAVLKLTDTYDIFDPATGQNIGIAKEEPPTWAKWLRLVVKKHQMPTAINIYEGEDQSPVVSVKRGFTFLRSKLRVSTGDGRSLGYFRSKLISIGGGFHVFDHADQQVAEVKGNWKGWDFKFLNKSGREIGKVTKKWAGLGKELFTSADNYVISLTDVDAAHPDNAALLLAAGLAIDAVFKERE